MRKKGKSSVLLHHLFCYLTFVDYLYNLLFYFKISLYFLT
jgi:hypothetical protein